MLKNNRKHQRRALNYPAWIALDIDKLIECVVLNISESGAKLKVIDNANIPDQFVLLFSKNGSPRRTCRVSWRTSDEIGVQFEKRTADEVSLL
jgi:hypothetical protein